MKFRFSIDRGGTFTDIYCEVEYDDGRVEEVEAKLLSEDPTHYSDAPLEGIRRIMEQKMGCKIPTTKDIDTSKIEYVRMGTTVATNALLERKGEPCALVITKGFGDLLAIGNQSRPDIFDLEINKPSVLYKYVVEVDERVKLLQDEDEDNSRAATDDAEVHDASYKVDIIKPVDLEAVRRDLMRIRDEHGIRSLAVVMVHSYAFPDHELQIGELAQELGFSNISLSHQVMPMIRAVPRGGTTCVDAYLTPIIRHYVNNFFNGFDNAGQDLNVNFMQSDGGLTPAHHFKGSHAILSGPAGGVVGYARTAYDGTRPVIGFDMGGTSSDVSRYGGEFEHVFETETAGVTIQAPQLDINTVAAGGGSRLFFRSGMFVVGPESSGSHPGPICYRKGGYLSVTDANLFLGRLVPDFFPKIFGETEDQPLDVDATARAFEQITEEINEFNRANGQREMSPHEVAFGFVKVANESMCRPIRNMTVAKGYDTRDHILSTFGGAGAQHCCAIARALGMSKVVVHRYSGILSAYGLSMADVVKEVQEPCARTYNADSASYFEERLNELTNEAVEKLLASMGVDADSKSIASIDTIKYLNMRYVGTDFTIMVNLPDGETDYIKEFESRYQREYGFTIQGRNVVVDDIRVRAVAHTTVERRQIQQSKAKMVGSKIETADGQANHDNHVEVLTHMETYFEESGLTRTPVYRLNDLPTEIKIEGPCIIIQDTSTIVVLPECTAYITEHRDVEITIHYRKKNEKRSTELDPVQLSIFNHRFMSIAEQMGRTLQRTSISTNIKERLDFSCALFSPDGNLVANAPHLPVHIGSMSEAVRHQIKLLGSQWKPDEVIVMNHPATGGTHLPDITVITPVCDKSTGVPVFYVASRGHHADIGGITPGSMPPFSRFLHEEGAPIKSFKLVKNGQFQLEGISELLKDSRSLKDCIADLKAQVAANHKGIALINGLIEEYTLEVVHAYMKYVRENAELAVRNMLRGIIAQNKKNAMGSENHVLQSVDHLDDGTRIQLSVTLFDDDDSSNGVMAEFDFTGTSEQIIGNLNAPVAVTMSAILYCLRCMVNVVIPLNEGCLRPIRVIIPQYSVLNPSEDVGVVAGNVLTSQRVTDVVLRAFGVCAASSGCMNNVTFGNEKFGYYETVCGGSGAGPTWHGKDAVHTHMTNTRITDVEILEKRYPILLRQFSIRRGSGGQGKFCGGNGVVREFEFLEDMTFGILSERRVFSPYGMHGGETGAKGKNILIRKNTDKGEDGKWLSYNLGSRNAIQVRPGDRVVISTPGGGGWESPQDKE